MKIAIFNVHNWEKDYLQNASNGKHTLKMFDTYLTLDTVDLAKDCDAICIFTEDNASAPILDRLHELGVKYVALRSAGFNNIDVPHAKKLGIRMARVPEYSPYAIAEFTVGVMLALNRKLVRTHYRIMEMNFSLNGLVGFDMNGKTVGIIGTGKIGRVVAKILHGFGCKLLLYDIFEDKSLVEKYDATYTDLDSLCKQSDIITLHAPLNAETHHLIDEARIADMKKGVMLINAGRGGLVKTIDVINGLKSGQIGYFGMDVYEEEKGLYFEDHSEDILQDDSMARLMTLRNVLISSHQAFLTDTALNNISRITFDNLECMEKGDSCINEIK
ncbi:2-hydroxyacid dehydrogenase [Zobellia laminariae]|uniref:2-hydroxyacid dehydrogenase n=1 Tax=Zobellia barbeyronii TaxID=2748009 RepID=A0ABS5WDW8_9FLAO|nr:2-hydroxyacid dehydrogenase [Zobellia barbeyronii]MBT2161599.1 2-hydroxyacid dehydrogenase [Zobellia barbeyronii]MUH41411.1 2-hydroxyacid dehydrogenase [Zobellia laminariae]